MTPNGERRPGEGGAQGAGTGTTASVPRATDTANAPAVVATVTALTRRGTVARWSAIDCPHCTGIHVHRRPRGADDGLRRAHCGRGSYVLDSDDDLGRGGAS